MESHANCWRSICPWHDDSDDEHSNSAASKKRRCRDLSWGHSVGRATRGRLLAGRARMKRGKPASGGGSSKKVEKPITSFFFKQPSPAKAPAAKPSVVDDDEKASASPPSKRRRGSDEEPPAAPVTQKPPTPGKPEEDAPAVDAPATATRYAPAVAAVTAAALASIAPSQPDRHDRFVRKLALDHRRRDGTNRGGAEGEDGDPRGGPAGAQNAGFEPGDEPAPREGSRYARRPGAAASTSASSVGGSSSKAQNERMKMTPLEEQVRRHKAEHPGVVLLIEVGYKFHFYGEDARVAAKTLNIFAYQSRNYLTASVPVPRLHVYVRRLVDAGHKVGVIRQTETAALKAAGEYVDKNGETSGKSGLFERKLVGLYTKSTLEAGVAVDPGGGANAVAGASAPTAIGAPPAFCSASRNRSMARHRRASGSRRSTRAPATCGTPSSTTGRRGRFGIQAAATLAGGGSAGRARVRRDERARRRRVRRGEGRARRAHRRRERIRGRAGRGAGAGEVRRASRRERKRRRRVVFVGKTPTEKNRQTLCPVSARRSDCAAAATAFDWLRPFGLDGVSRLAGSAAAFKPMAGGDDGGGTVRLSPNVIRQLELFRSSEDTHRGSLVWLLGANAITAGARGFSAAGSRTRRRASARSASGSTRCASSPRRPSPTQAGAWTRCRRRCGGIAGAGDAERYLARVFHGTATPAELVAALSAVRAFAGAVAEMAQKRPQTNRADESLEGLSGVTSHGVFPVSDASPCASLLLRRLLAEAATQETVATCASLLSAVDAEAARARGAPRPPPRSSRTPRASPSWRRRARRSRRRSGPGRTSSRVARTAPSAGRPSDGAAGADGAGSRKTPPLKKTLVASRAAIPAKLGYVTVALVEHLIELPDTAEGVPHDWVRVSTNKSKKGCAVPPAGGAGARAALERARERHVRACEAAWRHFLSVECAGKFLELRAATRAAAGARRAVLARGARKAGGVLLPDVPGRRRRKR